MPPRPHWKGYLKLSLVSCPVALYPAVSAAERLSFRQVNRATGHRVRQQLVDTVTGEAVAPHNKGRGYEVGENQFLIVQDEELETARQEARTRPFSAALPTPPAPTADTQGEPRRREAAPKLVETRQREEEPAAAPVLPPRHIENNRTIDLDRCVRGEQFDPRYYLTPYYIAPREDVGEEAFAVIRDAMAASGLVGMGRVVLASRERPIIVQPMGTGLLGMTLRYAHEVRSEVDYFENIPNMTLPKDMLQLAEHILETKTEDFDSAYLEDRYRTVLVEKLREKHAKMPMKIAPSSPSRQNVISLMDALKHSLAVEGPRRSIQKIGSTPTATTRTERTSKKPSARARRGS